MQFNVPMWWIYLALWQAGFSFTFAIIVAKDYDGPKDVVENFISILVSAMISFLVWPVMWFVAIIDKYIL